MALVADALEDLPALPRSRSALPLSLLLHGALLIAVLWFMHPQPHDDPAELESVAVDIINVQTASDSDVVAQSDATQSMVAAGATPVVAEPVETTTETLEPVSALDAQHPMTVEAVDPAPSPQDAQPVITPADPVPPDTTPTPIAEATSTATVVEQVAATQPAQLPLLVATQPPTPTLDSVAAIDPAEAATTPAQSATAPATAPPASVEPAPVETTSLEPPSSVAPASDQPPSIQPSSIEPAPTEPPSAEPTTVEAVQPVTAAAVEPQTSPQPEPVKKAEPPKQPDPQPKPKKPPARKQSATGGSGGKSDANAQASAAPKGGAGQVAAGGTGSQSRYPGLVQARLKRALRSPPGNQRGQAYVSFLVHADGSVSNIQVVGSAGSSALDDAAAATVRRAAPFPPIPADAGRSSWSFTLPLRFR